MPESQKETHDQDEPINLYVEDGKLSPTGEWADYLHHLGSKFLVRRETPSVIDPEDAYLLSRVPEEQLISFLSTHTQKPEEVNSDEYWITRLKFLEEEIDKIGPDNSKLGISLLTLKGFIENQLHKTNQAVGTLPEANLVNMFGNGLKVIEMTEKTVKLAPVNQKNEQLLTDRATALNRLGACYQDMGMVRVPKTILISSKQKYVEVERARGFSLASINRQQQTAIHELPINVRTHLITQFLQGIHNLNLQGLIFGDYNSASFNFDPQENQLWVTDPGVSEVSSGEYYKPIPDDQAGQEEIYKMFEGNAFIGVMEILGIEMDKLTKLRELSASKQLHDVSQVIDIVRS